MSVLVPIGDFSRMTHLSVKALRFYHDQGLLEPARIDPATGYRFYDPRQVPVAQVIRRFRDLGNSIGVAVTGLLFFGALNHGYGVAFERSVLQMGALLLVVAAFTRLMSARTSGAR